MNKALAYILVAVLAVLQVSAAPFFEIKGVGFNLVVMFVVAWLLSRGRRHVDLILFSGILLDLTTFERFGAWTISFLAAMAVFMLFEKRFSGINAAYSGLLLASLFTFICIFLEFLLQKLFGLMAGEISVPIDGRAMLSITGSAIYTLVAMALLWRPLMAAFRRFGDETSLSFRK